MYAVHPRGDEFSVLPLVGPHELRQALPVLLPHGPRQSRHVRLEAPHRRAGVGHCVVGGGEREREGEREGQGTLLGECIVSLF